MSLFKLPLPHFEMYWFPTILVGCIAWAVYVIKTYKPPATLFMFYLVAYPIFTAFNQQLGYNDYSFTLHLKYVALGSVVMVLLATKIDEVPKEFSLFLAALSLVYPVLGNYSLTACMMLCFMAYYGFHILYLLPVILYPTALGVGGFFFYLLTLWIGNWGLFLLPLPWFLTKYDFFSDRGRFNLWELSIDFIFRNKGFFYGYGANSFSQYGPNIAPRIDYADHLKLYFIFIHNDFLQYFFEYGLLGVLFGLPVLYLLRDNLWFPVVVFVTLFNYPFRNAVFGLILGVWILNSLKKPKLG